MFHIPDIPPETECDSYQIPTHISQGLEDIREKVMIKLLIDSYTIA